MAQPFIYLASCCYGGVAHARFMRSVLALRAECARRDIALQLDLGGGEALISRARAGMLARFLATTATHLLFVEGDQAFEAEEVLRPLEGSLTDTVNAAQFVLVRRSIVEDLSSASIESAAKFTDVRGSEFQRAATVFESVIDPASRRYLSSFEPLGLA